MSGVQQCMVDGQLEPISHYCHATPRYARGWQFGKGFPGAGGFNQTDRPAKLFPHLGNQGAFMDDDALSPRSEAWHEQRQA